MRITIVLFGFLASNAFSQFLSERWDAQSETFVVTVKTEAVHNLQVIANAPYSALVIWQQTQSLENGGSPVIWPATVTRAWRDSQGRNRSETAKPGRSELNRAGRFYFTEIFDPVGRIAYMLDDEARIAYRFAGPVGPVPLQSEPPKEHGTTVKESLGSRYIEGIAVDGTKVTKTIPAGDIGNATPIVSTSEEWYSPELKRELLGIFLDPKRGEVVKTVTQISRTEPDPSWFAPPPGYLVAEGKGLVRIVVKRHDQPPSTEPRP